MVKGYHDYITVRVPFRPIEQETSEGLVEVVSDAFHHFVPELLRSTAREREKPTSKDEHPLAPAHGIKERKGMGRNVSLHKPT
jgi:hypothetical protein